MQKFALLLEYLQQRGIARNENTYRPGKARIDLLELAHCPKFVARFIAGELSNKEVRRMGLPWSEGLVKRTLISPNGTFLTAGLALRHGLACHLAGGTHHAHRDFDKVGFAECSFSIAMYIKVMAPRQFCKMSRQSRPVRFIVKRTFLNVRPKAILMLNYKPTWVINST